MENKKNISGRGPAHWQALALFFENVMREKGMTRNGLAVKIGVPQSTVKRFFELEFCLRFDKVLAICQALDLNIFFEDRESESELNALFEDAMDRLERRAVK